MTDHAPVPDVRLARRRLRDNDWSAPEIQRLGRRSARSTTRWSAPAPGCSAPACSRRRSATVVRAAGGDVSMTDGPYAETKEQMGGFWVIEAPDLDAALEWAGKAPPPARARSRSAPCRWMADALADIFRREAGRCTATLIRVLGDIDLAEDAVAEAFAIAAEQWPTEGVPPNPGGWITTTARNRAIDRLRRESTRTDRHLAAHRLHADDMEPDPTPTPSSTTSTRFVDVVPDDQLRLMFLCCHPALGGRRPGRADAAAARRARHPRDRPRLPRPRADAGPADRAGQAQAARQPRPLPGPPRRRAPRPAATPCWRRST